MRCVECEAVGLSEPCFCECCGRPISRAEGRPLHGAVPCQEGVEPASDEDDGPTLVVAPATATCESCGAPARQGADLCEACEQTYRSVLEAQSPPIGTSSVEAGDAQPTDACLFNDPVAQPAAAESALPLDAPSEPAPWWQLEAAPAPPVETPAQPLDRVVATPAPSPQVPPFVVEAPRRVEADLSAAVTMKPAQPLRRVPPKPPQRPRASRRRLLTMALSVGLLATVGLAAALVGAPVMSSLRWPGTAEPSGPLPSDPVDASITAEMPGVTSALSAASAASPAGAAPAAGTREPASGQAPPARSAAPGLTKPTARPGKPVTAPGNAAGKKTNGGQAFPAADAGPATIQAVDLSALAAARAMPAAPVASGGGALARSDANRIAVDGLAFETGQVDVRPVVTRRVEPVPPRGVPPAPGHVVVLRVLVDASGRVADVQVVRRSTADRAYDAAAAAAVREWTFSPAIKREQAVSCWVYVGVPFGGASE